MMHLTRRAPLMCHTHVAMGKQFRVRQNHFLGIFTWRHKHRKWEKHRWNLAKHDSRSWVFFPLHCERERRQHISLFWTHMLPSSHSAIHRGKCVCVCVHVFQLVGCSESWHPTDGFILTFPCNMGNVSFHQGGMWYCEQRQRQVRFVFPVRGFTT